MNSRSVPKWSLVWLVLWITFSGIAFFLVPSPTFELSRALQLGFDSFGRPLASLVLTGSFRSLVMALFATLAAGSLAWLITTIRFGLQESTVASARFTRLLDDSLSIALSFPSLLVALVFAAVFGAGWSTLILALTVGSLPSLLRLLWSQADDVRTEFYVEAARATGASPMGLFVNHVLPGVWEVYALKLPQLFAHALLAEAALSFLGLGAPAQSESWGTLLAQGQNTLIEAPSVLLIVGLPLVITLLALQSLSEKK